MDEGQKYLEVGASLLMVSEVSRALGILGATRSEILLECRRRKTVDLVTTENNGPATIVTLCDGARKALAKEDLEQVEGFLDDIEHLARVTCEYIHQIRAVECKRWFEVRKEYEDKAAADKARYQAMSASQPDPLADNRPPMSDLGADLLGGHKPC